VTSPDKRAAWKTQFLKNQPSPAVAAQTPSELSADRKASVKKEMAKMPRVKSAVKR
jgi:hypothetical protein